MVTVSWRLATATRSQEGKGCVGFVALTIWGCDGDEMMLMFYLWTSALAGGAGGHRGRALCTECLEKLPHPRPRHWSSLPNLYHQGPGEATHDSRWEAQARGTVSSLVRTTV